MGKLRLTKREQQFKDELLDAVSHVLQRRIDKIRTEAFQEELKKRLDDFYR